MPLFQKRAQSYCFFCKYANFCKGILTFLFMNRSLLHLMTGMHVRVPVINSVNAFWLTPCYALEIILGHQLYTVVGDPVQIVLRQTARGDATFAVLNGSNLILQTQLELAYGVD